MQSVEELYAQIEELKLENKKLQEENKDLHDKLLFLGTAADNMPNPIFMKDQDGKFVFFNKKYAESFGMSKEDYIGKSVLDLSYLPMEDRHKYQAEDLLLIESGAICSYNMDYIFEDGKTHPSFYWSKGFVCEDTGKHGLVGEIVDISEERELQGQLDEMIRELEKRNIELTHESETDAGTGVYNRFKLKKLREQNHEGSCLLMLDMDHFKRINDTFGHQKGDEVLLRLTTMLKNPGRNEDVLIRYGGEEFLVFLNNVTIDEALAIAEKIRKKAENNLILPDGSYVTTSVGCVEYDAEKTLEENIELVDQALYYAKEHGRNCIAGYRNDEIFISSEKTPTSAGGEYGRNLSQWESSISD